MAAKLIVIGPKTGEAYAYARARFGPRAPEACFVPVSAFALAQYAHLRKQDLPDLRVVVLQGSTDRADWIEWQSVFLTQPMRVEFL